MAQEEIDVNEGSFADQVEAELLSDVVSPVDLPGDPQDEADPFEETYGQDDLDLTGDAQTPISCPTCGSPKPEKHPAVQFEGEVQVCGDRWHTTTAEGRKMLEQAASPVVEVQGIDPNNFAVIRQIPGFELFKDAYRLAFDSNRQLLEAMQDILVGLPPDDDQLAILFREALARKSEQNRVDETREWANQQGDIIPNQVEQVEMEAGTYTPGSDQPMVAPASLEQLQDLPADPKPASRDTDPETYDEDAAHTDKIIRELQDDVTRLEQASMRDDLAVQNWADVADFFNQKLAASPYADSNEPLVDRIKAYVNDMEDAI